jgi:hypothetical protein
MSWENTVTSTSLVETPLTKPPKVVETTILTSPGAALVSRGVIFQPHCEGEKVFIDRCSWMRLRIPQVKPEAGIADITEGPVEAFENGGVQGHNMACRFYTSVSLKAFQSARSNIDVTDVVAVESLPRC